MVHRRSDQEWLELLQQYESSTLTQKEFCQKNKLALSTFFTKRRSLQCSDESCQGGFVRAEVVEQTTRYNVAQPTLANMILSFNHVKLSVPQGIPANYLAELINALQS